MSELQTNKEAPVMEHQCAVHDVVMDSLNTQIDRVNRGQEELKQLIVTSHQEMLDYTRTTSDENRKAIDKISDRLDTEVKKFYERDREYLNSINALKIKHAVYTAIGVGVAGTLSFLLSAMRVAEIVIN